MRKHEPLSSGKRTILKWECQVAALWKNPLIRISIYPKNICRGDIDSNSIQNHVRKRSQKLWVNLYYNRNSIQGSR
jgi:hypothetical protein